MSSSEATPTPTTPATQATVASTSSIDSQVPEDDSDMGSSFDDMDYWAQRCSICFDAPLDLCLDFCRDQYCITCFQRYVTEVVKSSWGLSVTKVKCPVCQELIPQAEWSQYVSKAVVDQYNKYNQPYRAFSRCCPACEHEAIPCDELLRPKKQHTRHLHETIDKLAHTCGRLVPEHHQEHHEMLEEMLQLLHTDAWSHTKLLELYKGAMDLAKAIEQYHHDNSLSMPVTAYDVSREFLVIEMAPETWKQLQFMHIGYFPTTTCMHCQLDFCLQCGFETHPGVSCEEHMKQLTNTNDDTRRTVEWQLKHSRRCPSCSIMINRDEGCNKVDCSLCGFVFCWSCRAPWSDKCGFYHCAQSGDAEDKRLIDETNTELGVPDISTIQARMSLDIHRPIN
ncbi:hypothetical protein BC940DRAFT_261377 [Gongronella butleri]|nr:hypothetical protein BC940DRAFT_261377 [Gongronella butleri]